MKVVNSIEEITEIVKNYKKQNKIISLVPTMGALHLGHIELVKQAKLHSDIVIVSIFVNKTQFNDPNDFVNYPKTFNADCEILSNHQVDYLFMPDDGDIYKNKIEIDISMPSLTNCLCGKYRENHFSGVLLIVSKLFNIIQPDLAVFGEKDFQQLTVIKKLVEDLNFPIKIIACPTVRINQGLALSSRNSRLNQQQLLLANNIYLILNEIKNNIIADQNIIEKKIKEMLAIGIDKVEYLEIRNEKNLQLVEPMIGQNYQNCRIFTAVFIGKVRLIDNLAIC